MTELSFNEQSNQVSNDTKVDDTASSEDEGYCEKHVRINDEDLPVVYKPKSYSQLTDDTNYEHIIHQHPALKFSISSTHANMNGYFSSSKQSSCSPFLQRKNKILGVVGNKDTISVSSSSASPQWKKKELTRKRGRTFPPYAEVYNVTSDTEEKPVASSSSSNTPKWFNFLKKINVFPKFQRNRSKSRRKNNSFDHLPPIRVSFSVDNLDLADDAEETNNNTDHEDHHESHLFTQTKSYRPASECVRKSRLAEDDYKDKQVALKRVNSLPIL